MLSSCVTRIDVPKQGPERREWLRVASQFFHVARRDGMLVTVTDVWGRTVTGRVYRNARDRTNVVTVDGSMGVELFYGHMLSSAERARPEPAGLPKFPVDWDRFIPDGEPI